jgi:hypothetical protein
VRPVARGSDASANVCRAKPFPPAAIAACATVQAPCTYPSTLTTAMIRVRVRALAIAPFLVTPSGERLQRGRLEVTEVGTGSAESAGHCCILGSCVGSAYLRGQS